MRKKSNLSLHRKKSHKPKKKTATMSTVPDQGSVAEEMADTDSVDVSPEIMPERPAIRRSTVKQQVTSDEVSSKITHDLVGLPARMMKKIEKLVTELADSGYESMLIVVKLTSGMTAKYGSGLGRKFLRNVPNTIQDFHKFCSDESTLPVEECKPDKTRKRSKTTESRNSYSRKKATEVVEQSEHLETASEDEEVMDDYTNQPTDDIENNGKTTLHNTLSDNLTFLDFLKIEPEKEPVAVLSDNDNIKDNSNDKVNDLDQDPEFVNLSKSVISTFENMEEIKGQLKVEENGKYKCILCGSELKCKYKMMRHLDSHERVVKQLLKKCDLCDVRLPESFIIQHRQTHSQTCPPLPTIIACVKRDIRNDLASFLVLAKYKKHRVFRCRYCNIKFTGGEYFKNHFMGQHTMKYVCQLCGESLYSFLQMFKHVRHHKDEQEAESMTDRTADTTDRAADMTDQEAEGNEDISCPYCQKKHTSQESLVAHIMDEHVDTNFVKFPCIQCKRSFITNSALKLHIQTHSQVFLCKADGCSKSFESRKALLCHEKNHMATGRTKSLCSMCGQVFSSKGRLQQHMDFTHNGREPIKCNVCSTLFRSTEGYRRHMKIHTAEGNNFVCEQCGQSFNTSERFWHHKRKHLDKKNYTCLRCRATFTKMDSLEIHLVNHRHFSEEQPESLIKYKTCSHCGKILTNGRQLSRHIDRAHAKPKTCPYCGKQFRDRSNLRMHMQSHTNTKPRCGICNSVFRSKVKLDGHMVTDHPDVRRLVETSIHTHQSGMRRLIETSIPEPIVETSRHGPVVATSICTDQLGMRRLIETSIPEPIVETSRHEPVVETSIHADQSNMSRLVETSIREPLVESSIHESTVQASIHEAVGRPGFAISVNSDASGSIFTVTKVVSQSSESLVENLV